MYASQNHSPNFIETVAWSHTFQLWLSLCTKCAFVQNLTIPNLMHLTSKASTDSTMHFQLTNVAFPLFSESILHHHLKHSVFHHSTKDARKTLFAMLQNDISAFSSISSKKSSVKRLFGLLQKELRRLRTPAHSARRVATADV